MQVLWYNFVRIFNWYFIHAFSIMRKIFILNVLKNCTFKFRIHVNFVPLLGWQLISTPCLPKKKKKEKNWYGWVVEFSLHNLGIQPIVYDHFMKFYFSLDFLLFLNKIPNMCLTTINLIARKDKYIVRQYMGKKSVLLNKNL